VIERDVAARLAAADYDGAATLTVRGYGPQILGYLRATLPADHADDAFSIFCESLWKGLPKFRAESTVLTWAYRLAWGAVRRVLDSPARKRMVHMSSSAMVAIAQEVRSTTAIHLRQQTADHLAHIRAQLDPDERTLLVLRVDRDLSWTEVAEIMEADAAALRKRFERVKAKIKKLATA